MKLPLVYSRGALIAVLLVFVGCAKETNSKEPTGTAPGNETNAAAEPTTGITPPKKLEPPVAAGESVTTNDPSYSLSIDAPKTLAPGAEGVTKVTVIPGTGWKMNKDFPTRMQITPPEGVTMVKDNLVIADAERFDAKGAVFAIKFKADAAGDKSFAASFKFAVCTDATCDPKKQELAWVVKVE